jgi:hypothetical protein
MTRTLDGQSPSRVQSYLGGVSYPASKDQLLDVARQNRAPVGVLEILRRLNEAAGQFVGPKDVIKDVTKACTERQGRRPATAVTRRDRPTNALQQRTSRDQISRGAGSRRRSAVASVQHSGKEHL